MADENSESDSLPKYTTISRTRSTESDPDETTSPKYVTLRRQRPTFKEDEISYEESTPMYSTPSTSQTPRYIVNCEVLKAPNCLLQILYIAYVMF